MRLDGSYAAVCGVHVLVERSFLTPALNMHVREGVNHGLRRQGLESGIEAGLKLIAMQIRPVPVHGQA